MALVITHTYVSGIADSGDTSVVQPSNWNANHTLTGAASAAQGGTGFSSYAVGDVLYADTTSTLAKLADVATGNALISGGVNTAPSYGKIGLTTHISGILAATNGGTGQSTFAKGDILASPGSNTLNKLSVGTDGFVLTADAASTNGVKWSAGSSSILPLHLTDANTVEQYNSTTAQAFKVYNTFTDTSNYERGVFDWTTSAGVLTIGNQAAGTGSTRTLRLIGNSGVQVTAAGALTLTASGGAVSISATVVVTMDAPLAFSSAVSLATPITASTYSQAASDSFLTFNASGTCTLTLLNPAGSHAFTQLFVRTIAAQAVVSASSNVVPLVGGSAGTPILAATAGKWAMLVSDGTVWQIIAAN